MKTIYVLFGVPDGKGAAVTWVSADSLGQVRACAGDISVESTRLPCAHPYGRIDFYLPGDERALKAHVVLSRLRP